MPFNNLALKSRKSDRDTPVIKTTCSEDPSALRDLGQFGVRDKYCCIQGFREN